jgi:DUF4097 and DUF4098 domain-containing protein YvlB
MGNGNRTVWIVVIVIAVAVLLCCCVAVVGAAVTGLLTTAPVSREVGFGRVEERTEQIFTVGETPTLVVDNFAGAMVVRRGEPDQIRIITTKKAMNERQLNQIDVDMVERGDSVRIQATRPGVRTGNASVDFEIYVPADSQLDLDTGAGNTQIFNVSGAITAHTGAGNVRVQGAVAPVTLETGAGNIDYEGEPQGDCTFENGAGSITLHLPEDTNVEVELTSGIGNIDLGGFDVEGETSRTEVDGVIGTGDEGTIEAHTGAGNITLARH